MARLEVISGAAAGLLALWSLAGLADRPKPPPASLAPAPALSPAAAPAAPSALGDFRTLSHYPGP